MSRKLVVAALATAGTVGFGSAAAAVSVDVDEVQRAVTKSTNVNSVADTKLNGQRLTDPPRKRDAVQALDDLSDQLSSGTVVLPEDQIRGRLAQLAGAADDLARSIDRSNSKLSGGKVEAADRLATHLERSAGALRRVPAKRAKETATVNDEAARGLRGLRRTLHRVGISVGAPDRLGKVLSDKSVKTSLTDMLAKIDRLDR